eukprot:Hpha_TRINITY_DN16376_c1_g3::TRINITY_DN16376_c1_g3_i1::g.61891::m.61891
MRSRPQGSFSCRHCGAVIDGSQTRSIGQHRRRCRSDTPHAIVPLTQLPFKSARLLQTRAQKYPRLPTSAALRSMRDGREYRLHPTHAQRRAAAGVIAGKAVRHGAATSRGVLRNTIPFVVRGAGSLRPSIVKARVPYGPRPSMVWLSLLVEVGDIGKRVPEVPPIAAKFVSYEPRSMCAVLAKEPPDRFKQPHENC